ncbi:NUDIX domain-containing protein [Loktanella sp. SALINAS62]|uniref:NUDIX domain-containing protein n=1 Tax=Loktanella sp. SALINAS62 TaxID=2706124 RepID=UPI001B8C32F9|nr:NUDIX domain-containing protein [Loktanella sp. SALINAS62]MBS1303501.1 NUDIX domain-containing protein [Loktanella sp. SALINAS62]
MRLFVYGTLRDAELRDAVAGPGGSVSPAMLRGYAVKPLADSVVPLIVPQRDAVAPGLVWDGLTTAQADRLALYEGAYDYSLITVTVTDADGGDMEAMMWLPPADARAGDGDWSFDHWQTHYAETSVLAATALFQMQPPPSPQDLRWQFPMIQKRAWTQTRASGQGGPATLRHRAGVDDVTVTQRKPAVGDFFRLQGFSVTHRRFDGAMQGPLPREVFVGVEAVLVLPYDPLREKLVLVEQIRMGALERGDPNPWILEPVAGMIDAFETPEQAALRETREEAGLDVRLRHVTSCYPSPGNATDYFHCYIGLADIADETPWSGGLAAEHEDLRVHVVTLDHALDLVATGEVNVAPAVMLIYWLAINRAALRVEFDGGIAS